MSSNSLEVLIEKTKKTAISERNKQDIIGFLKRKNGEVGNVRLDYYCIKLIHLAEWLKKDFRDTDEDDLRALVSHIDKDMGYEEWTKLCYKKAIKTFFKYLSGDDETPKKVKWIRTGKKNVNLKSPEELLSVKEVWEMVRCASSLRNKAFISILYESGARPHELLRMKLKHLEFNEVGVKITIPCNTKTGTRRLQLVYSFKFVKQYLETHPLKDDLEAPFWVSKWKGQTVPTTHATISKFIKETAEMAGIRKKIYPYIFRHSRATHLAQKLTEAQMKQYFGWTQDSKMASTYVSLSGRDLDDAVLALHGMKPVKDNKEEIIICGRCGKENKFGVGYCGTCGLPLELKAMINAEEQRDRYDNKMDKFVSIVKRIMEQNPEFKKIIDEIGKEMKE